MTVPDLIRDARKGRTDEQALVWLAEMVLVLRAGASAGMIYARRYDMSAEPTGAGTARLRLKVKEPIS